MHSATWQTPDAMDRLHERASETLENRELHPALVVGALVLDFTCIHPFLDGNGHVSHINARALPVFRLADIRQAVPTASDAYIRKVLHGLRDAGIIESTGRGRAAAWRRMACQLSAGARTRERQDRGRPDYPHRPQCTCPEDCQRLPVAGARTQSVPIEGRILACPEANTRGHVALQCVQVPLGQRSQHAHE